MQVSVYTPVTSALGIVSGVIGSLIFRERLGVFSYLAAAAAIIAVII
jgi:drug/metabolite transporter (DMT)-like permease